MASEEHYERSYGCTFACGNPYDYVFISVRDGTTEFLCLPCFVRLASDMVAAVTEPDPEQTAKWLKTISPLAQAPMKSNGVKRGRKNAPATSDDPELFDAFDSRIDASELPAEFR
jgi:hypothetical protein